MELTPKMIMIAESGAPSDLLFCWTTPPICAVDSAVFGSSDDDLVPHPWSGFVSLSSACSPAGMGRRGEISSRPIGRVYSVVP